MAGLVGEIGGIAFETNIPALDASGSRHALLN